MSRWPRGHPRPMSIDVVHRPEHSRFEAAVDGDMAVLTYARSGDSVEMLHTVVPVALERRGIGSALAAAAVGWARDEHLDVVPVCSFVRTWLERQESA